MSPSEREYKIENKIEHLKYSSSLIVVGSREEF